MPVLLLVSVTTIAQFKLQPSIGFGSQSIDYKFDGATVDGSSGISLGADLFYYLNDNIVVGAGVRFANYKATSSLNDFSIMQSGVDVDEHNYEQTKVSKGISETHTMSAIEIPLLLRYQKWVSGSFIVFGSTGPVFVIPGKLKTSFDSGTLNISGYYENWDLVIDDADPYGFGSRNLADYEPEIDSKTSLSWAIEAGVEYFINKRFNLMLTAYFQPGLSSIATSNKEVGAVVDPFAFEGSSVGASDVKINKIGLRLGINFDLSPPEKSSIKSIR